MKALEIDLHSLPPGESALETAVPAAELDVAEDQYVLGETVRLELDVLKGDTEIVFRGLVAAAATVVCSRCLVGFETTLEAPFSLTCHRVGGDSPMLRDGDDEEGVRFIPRDAASVELLDEVRSALLLSLPISPLCREECRGLCPRCGSDLNAGDCGCERGGGDLRWSALDALRPKQR